MVGLYNSVTSKQIGDQVNGHGLLENYLGYGVHGDMPLIHCLCW